MTDTTHQMFTRPLVSVSMLAATKDLFLEGVENYVGLRILVIQLVPHWVEH